MPKKSGINPQLQRYMDKYEELAIAFPILTRMMTDPDEGFSGLTMFQGDHGDFVVGYRRWDVDGRLLVCWTSASDPVSCLLRLNDVLKEPNWRVDKRSPVA